MDARADLEVLELIVDLLLLPLGLALPGKPGPLLLLLELPAEAGLVDAQGLFPGQLLRQVEREAEGVIELEDLVAGKDRAALLPGLPDDLVEEAQARRKGEGEALLLGLADLGDVLDRGQELGIGVLHDVGDPPDELEEERPVDADEVPLPEGPADEPPQDIAPAVVGRRDAVADEEGHGPDVVGDDPDRDVALVAGRVLAPGQIAHVASMRGLNRSVSKLLRLPWTTAVMRSRPMPVSIDGDGSGRMTPPGVLVELHEDEVPELDEAVAPLLDQARRARPPRCPRRDRSGSPSRARTGPVSPMAQKLSFLP